LSSEGFTLSQRQVEILVLLSHGAPYKHIARNLYLSPATVSYHVGILQERFRAPNLGALIGLAIVHGVLTPDQLPIEATGVLEVDLRDPD
jgi:DNA-binding CsgD family transcriptional regulator